MNLLKIYPELKDVDNPYIRFYMYRRAPISEIPDIDRSPYMKELYSKLNWYSAKTESSILEPDTFFASSHNLIHKLFNMLDKTFYVDDFELLRAKLGITTKREIKILRYYWLTNPSTMKHYEDIITSESLLRYIDNTHKLGNFLIVPKGFGAIKGLTLNEDPMLSLNHIMKNFNLYKGIYKVDSYHDWKNKFLLLDSEIEKLPNNLMLNKTVEEIIDSLNDVSEFIEYRTELILEYLKRENP